MRIPDSSSINSSSNQTELSSVKSSEKTGGSTSSSSTSSSSSPDQVSLSGPSQLLRSSAAERSSRLATLAASVRSGQYEVPASTISKSLISETLARSASS